MLHLFPITSRRGRAAGIRNGTALLALLGLLAGCGGSATGSPSSAAAASPPISAQPSANPTATSVANGPVDICALITESEATSALGHDPGPAIPVEAGVCAYGGTPPAAGSFSISTPAGGSLAAFDSKKSETMQRAKARGYTFQEVSGVGEAAFMTSGGNSPASGALLFIKGNSFCQILAFTLSPPATPAAVLTTLGKAAAARL